MNIVAWAGLDGQGDYYILVQHQIYYAMDGVHSINILKDRWIKELFMNVSELLSNMS